MTAIPFGKLHGAGNDYVVVDAVREPSRLGLCEGIAAAVSDRHRGIGGDGLIAIAADPENPQSRLRMHMWNADGSRGAVCGNGLRCAARFAHDEGLIDGLEFEIESDAAIHRVTLIADPNGAMTRARVTMGGVDVDEPESIEVDEQPLRIVAGSAGNPHAVVFVDCDPEQVDVTQIGTALQTHDRFPDGVNVEFVQVTDSESLRQRTFERGSGETMACGSGATFAAAAAIHLGVVPGPEVTVRLRGGALQIERSEDGEFSLTGPVSRVFEGTFRVAASES